LPVQYADYAVWQREWLRGEALERQLSYWRERLKDAPELLELPTDRPRPAVQSFSGARQTLVLSKELTDALKALCRRESSTLFMTLLAALQALLWRYTGQDHVVVGTDIANRNRAETEGLIGFFINQLVLHTDLSGDPTLGELLGRVRETTLGAYAHQDMPFDKLVEVLQPERNMSHSPMFQVKLVLQNTPTPEAQLPGLEVKSIDFYAGRAKLDMTLFAGEVEGGLGLLWEYNTDLFDDSTVARMLSHFELLLTRLTSEPETRLSELRGLIEVAGKESKVEEKKRREESNLKKFKSVRPKAVSVPQEGAVKTGSPREGATLPLVVEPSAGPLSLIEWADAQREFVERKLLEHGALLLRGFRADLLQDFERLALTQCPSLFNENGEHPRQAVSGNVYTPVFYPPEQQLLWHNENSFNQQWPRKIFFGCLRPAARGGETPVVDSRRVYDEVDAGIRRRFAEKQIMYVRNYGEGLGLDWQTVFRTGERALVEEQCRRAGMQFEWKPDGGLRTRAVRPAVIRHPRTGEWVWFNQAQHWHVSCLDPATREALVGIFSEEDLPRNCYFGDGARIDDAVMDEILGVYRRLEVVTPWREGDVLIIDNLLAAHGRNSFEGERRLLVAMGEMLSYEEVEGGAAPAA
jgi:alpha-ketoglutarate-dependent taurine dioxygenase